MLYATTRNRLDGYTVQHALTHAVGPDGGGWRPFHDPVFSQEELAALKERSFNGNVAYVLNKLYDCKLTSWDVDFCIGRYPLRLKSLSNRVVLGEPWHNPRWSYSYLQQRLAELIGASTQEGWTEIAIRIAVLVGVCGEMQQTGLLQPGECMDVAVLSGDFSGPISAWYSRKWGLPIGSIVCCCNENNTLWNLICHGSFHTDVAPVATCVPGADITLPRELERLVADCGSIQEMEDYLGCCHTGRTYFPDELTLAAMRKDLFVSVVSSHRIAQTISGVYATHKNLLAGESALVYSGLQDYRAKKGQLRQAVVMTGMSPVLDARFVGLALGIDPETVKDYV